MGDDHRDEWGAEAAAKISRPLNMVRGSAKGSRLHASSSGQDSFRRRSAKSKMERGSPSESRRSPLQQSVHAGNDVDPQNDDICNIDTSLRHHRDPGDYIDEGADGAPTKCKAKSSKRAKDPTATQTQSDKHHTRKPEPSPPESSWTDCLDQRANPDRLNSGETQTTHKVETISPATAQIQEGTFSRSKRRPQAQFDTDASHHPEIVKPKEQPPDEDTAKS
jgi:hypothetical protein